MFLAGILTPSSSFCQTEGPQRPIFLSPNFSSLPPLHAITSSFQRAQQAANENSGKHEPPSVEPELCLLERASR